MNILINLYPVNSGGGQQVASNLLRIIAKNDFGHNWFVFVGENTELHQLSKTIFVDKQIFTEKYNYVNRIFKLEGVKKYVENCKIDLIYSFGPILPLKNVPQVLRTVYSNLYFPEIDFWKDYPWHIKLKKKIIDYFRLKQTLKADGLIFENHSMLERAIQLFNYPESRTKYVEPSVTSFDRTEKLGKYGILDSLTEFKVLYLSSWYLNKNIHILPEVASILRTIAVKVKFVLSLDENNPEIQKYLVSKILQKNLMSYFEFVGKIESKYVHQVVGSCDAMILLSRLECFSSNIMEAFYFEKPLLISDTDWARSACQDGALFVDRNNPSDIAKNIISLIESETLQNNLTDGSRNRLKSFNRPIEKVEKQIKFLEYIKNAKGN